MKPRLIDWDKSYKRGGDYRQLGASRLAGILEHAGVLSGAALDLGCGTGQLVRDLYHRGFKAHGVDNSSHAVKQAHSSTVYGDRGLTFEERDLEAGDLGLNNFDIVFCKYVFIFIANKEGILQAVSDCMVPGGCFVLISPDPAELPPDKKSIGEDGESIYALCRRYFTEVELVREAGDQVFYCRNVSREAEGVDRK